MLENRPSILRRVPSHSRHRVIFLFGVTSTESLAWHCVGQAAALQRCQRAEAGAALQAEHLQCQCLGLRVVHLQCQCLGLVSRVPVYRWLKWFAQEAATQEEERTLRTIVAANIEDHCTLWVQTGLKVAQTRRGPGSGGENRANLIKHSDLALDNFLKHTSGAP